MCSFSGLFCTVEITIHFFLGDADTIEDYRSRCIPESSVHRYSVVGWAAFGKVHRLILVGPSPRVINRPPSLPWSRVTKHLGISWSLSVRLTLPLASCLRLRLPSLMAQPRSKHGNWWHLSIQVSPRLDLIRSISEVSLVKYTKSARVPRSKRCSGFSPRVFQPLNTFRLFAAGSIDLSRHCSSLKNVFLFFFLSFIYFYLFIFRQRAVYLQIQLFWPYPRLTTKLVLVSF